MLNKSEHYEGLKELKKELRPVKDDLISNLETLMEYSTVTLNLSDMSIIDYKRIMRKLKEISEDKLDTITYSGGMNEPLSEEHKKLLEKFSG